MTSNVTQGADVAMRAKRICIESSQLTHQIQGSLVENLLAHSLRSVLAPMIGTGSSPHWAHWCRLAMSPCSNKQRMPLSLLTTSSPWLIGAFNKQPDSSPQIHACKLDISDAFWRARPHMKLLSEMSKPRNDGKLMVGSVPVNLRRKSQWKAVSPCISSCQGMPLFHCNVNTWHLQKASKEINDWQSLPTTTW